MNREEAVSYGSHRVHVGLLVDVRCHDVEPAGKADHLEFGRNLQTILERDSQRMPRSSPVRKSFSQMLHGRDENHWQNRPNSGWPNISRTEAAVLQFGISRMRTFCTCQPLWIQDGSIIEESRSRCKGENGENEKKDFCRVNQRTIDERRQM